MLSYQTIKTVHKDAGWTDDDLRWAEYVLAWQRVDRNLRNRLLRWKVYMAVVLTLLLSVPFAIAVWVP